MNKNRPSRLKRLEERRAMRSTLLYILITIGIIAAMFFFGVPALSKLTSLVGNITRTGVDYSTDSPPPPPPVISTLPNFTKEDKLKITGKTRPGINVIIFFNDDKNEVLANADGEFTSVFDLSVGENSVYAYVEDNKGQKSAETTRYTVVLDKTAPELTIISPENGKSFYGVNQKRLQIEGQTEVEAKVTINERIVIVRSDGKFEYTQNLNNGENVFKIISTDQAGNSTEVEFKVSYSS